MRRPPHTEAEREQFENEWREIERARATCVPDSVREREVRADGGRERRCPECGEPVAVTAAHGPDRAILEPCGHTLPLTFVPELQGAK